MKRPARSSSTAVVPDMDETVTPIKDVMARGRPKKPERPEMSDEQRLDVMKRLRNELARMRTEAVDGRDRQGIEAIWREDEEFYAGIDDVNRHEVGIGQTWGEKPVGQAASNDRERSTAGSTVFVNICRPFADAASARMADMLMATGDDRSWSIEPTPVPEVIQMTKGEFPERLKRQVEKAVPGDDPEAVAAREKIIAEAIAEETKRYQEARAAAEKAQRQIDDWHVECDFHGQARKALDDVARIGTGVLKGPVPVFRRQMAVIKGKLVWREELQPMTIRVDPWNCFPDASCGENIHNGSYHWERDDIAPRLLRDLADDPTYIEEEIYEALREGPHEVSRVFDAQSKMPGLQQRERTGLFEIWYGYMSLSPEQLEAIGVELEESDTEFVPVVVTMVNNRIIKCARNHLESGDFPYDYMVWQRRLGLPWGCGVPRQIRTPQRIINSATRCMMDNAGLAGGPMWIFKQGLVYPLNGKFEIRPRKGWGVAEDAEIDDVSRAFQFIEMPMMQAEMEAIIMLAIKLAEDVSGLPMILQGQQGNAPDTVGGMQLLNNNATAVTRRVARAWDADVMEPHIRRYYEHFLLYSEDDEAKKDFQIDARGSSTLVERDMNAQTLQNMAQMVENPVFKIDPSKWAHELLKAMRMDPRKMEYTDEEWQQIVEGLRQQAAAAGQNPTAEAARIRAEAMIEQEKIRSQDRAADREQEQAFKTLEIQRDDELDQFETALASLNYELDQYQLADTKEGRDKENKARLAETAMKLQAQMRLSRERSAAGTPQAATPPTEPAGRAPSGQAFQK